MKKNDEDNNISDNNNNDDNTTNTNNNNSNLTEAEYNLLYSEEPIYKFVFTGGPCGGKTTALARVYNFLRERNFEVINVPEVYTILNSNGMNSEFFTTNGISKTIQGFILDCQMTFENGIYNVLKARGKPSIMLCDRGLMDGSIFVSDDEFNSVLHERNLNKVEIRDNRYDAIFHLITAADGAEEYYTLENNTVRWESKEQARIQDIKIQKAWVGHPHLYIIDNNSNFDGKLDRLIQIICKIVNLPSNLKRRSIRYLLKEPPNLSLFTQYDIKYQVFDVEKVYLQSNYNNSTSKQNQSSTLLSTTNEQSSSLYGNNIIDDHGNYSFIRRRTNIDINTGKALGSVYQITFVKKRLTTNTDSKKKDNNGNGVDINDDNNDVESDIGDDNDNNNNIIEQKRIISNREYDTLYQNVRDMNRHIVLQRRISFLYNRQSFNIHIYQQPINDLCILHAQVEAEKAVETTRMTTTAQDDNNIIVNNTDSSSTTISNNNNNIDLPPFLEIDRILQIGNGEDDEKYGAYSLSIIRDQ